MPHSVDILREAHHRGVVVDYLDFQSLSGCIVRSGRGRYYVGISSALSERTTRQTIAHEIAHIDTDTVDSVWSFRSEGKAYKRAREILIDDESLRSVIEDGYTDYGTLASLFGVSEKCVELRCRDLSLI